MTRRGRHPVGLIRGAGGVIHVGLLCNGVVHVGLTDGVVDVGHQLGRLGTTATRELILGIAVGGEGLGQDVRHIAHMDGLVGVRTTLGQL